VIHAAAGPELEAHSHLLAPLSVGAAIPTPGFRLPQRTVIHTRGPKYLFDPEPAKHLALAMTNTLLVADREKLARIAVPAISMGIYAYPHQEAVPILVDAARIMLPRLHYVREIRFVLVQRELLNLFQYHLRIEP
jgi:O-acetyl-ADP-ribose deacetylase (regulator of RNase III)